MIDVMVFVHLINKVFFLWDGCKNILENIQWGVQVESTWGSNQGYGAHELWYMQMK